MPDPTPDRSCRHWQSADVRGGGRECAFSGWHTSLTVRLSGLPLPCDISAYPNLETFNIERSLSLKGCPFDNAVAESTFKIFKAEFVHGRNFDSLERLRLELGDYINWFNNFRIHSSLGYLSPSEFKANTL